MPQYVYLLHVKNAVSALSVFLYLNCNIFITLPCRRLRLKSAPSYKTNGQMPEIKLHRQFLLVKLHSRAESAGASAFSPAPTARLSYQSLHIPAQPHLPECRVKPALWPYSLSVRSRLPLRHCNLPVLHYLKCRILTSDL